VELRDGIQGPEVAAVLRRLLLLLHIQAREVPVKAGATLDDSEKSDAYSKVTPALLETTDALLEATTALVVVDDNSEAVNVGRNDLSHFTTDENGDVAAITPAPEAPKDDDDTAMGAGEGVRADEAGGVGTVAREVRPGRRGTEVGILMGGDEGSEATLCVASLLARS